MKALISLFAVACFISNVFAQEGNLAGDNFSQISAKPVPAVSMEDVQIFGSDFPEIEHVEIIKSTSFYTTFSANVGAVEVYSNKTGKFLRSVSLDAKNGVEMNWNEFSIICKTKEGKKIFSSPRKL